MKAIMTIISLTYSNLIMLVLFILVSGCSNKIEDETLTATPYPVLNDLIESAPLFIVDLGNPTVQTIHIDESNILGRTESMPEDLFIASVDGLMKIDDYLYVADGRRNFIWKLDSDGTITGRYGRSGSGPGEFQNLAGLHSNREYIFAVDYMARNLHLFDHRFNYLTTVYHGVPLVRQNQVAVTDSIVLTANYYIGEANDSEKRLLQAYIAAPPLDEAGLFIAPIEPRGSINNFVTAGDGLNRIAFAFVSFPYILILDTEMNPIHTVALKRPQSLQPYIPEPVARLSNNPSLNISDLPPVIMTLHMSKNGDLFFVTLVEDDTFSGLQLHWIEKVDNGYSNRKTLRFFYEDSLEGLVNLQPRIMTTDGDTLYFADRRRSHVYRHVIE